MLILKNCFKKKKIVKDYGIKIFFIVNWSLGFELGVNKVFLYLYYYNMVCFEFIDLFVYVVVVV